MLLFMKGLQINMTKATGKQFLCKGIGFKGELQGRLGYLMP